MDMPVGSDWSGWYAGVTAGYGFGESEHHDRPVANDSSGVYDIDGALLGGTVGINMQSGNMVYGLESDFSISSISGSGPSSATWGCASGCATDVDWFATVRGRFGFDANGFMPYVTGGLAVANAESYFVSLATPRGSDVMVGWTAGGGIEKMLADSVSVKIEYLYSDLGTFTWWDFGGLPGRSPVSFHTVRGGINYHF